MGGDLDQKQMSAENVWLAVLPPARMKAASPKKAVFLIKNAKSPDNVKPTA